MLLQCRGVKKYGGEVKLNAHVDQVLMEKGRATGVLLKSGQVIKAKKVSPLVRKDQNDNPFSRQ